MVLLGHDEVMFALALIPILGLVVLAIYACGADSRIDEVAVGEIGQVGRQRKRAERGVALRRSHLLLVDFPLQEVRDPVVGFRPEFVRDLAAYGLVTRLDRQLRDPGTHCAEAHDTDPSDLRSGHERRS